MIPKLDALRDYCYYFQFSLTGCGRDIEANLPDKKEELISPAGTAACGIDHLAEGAVFIAFPARLDDKVSEAPVQDGVIGCGQ